MSDRLSRREVLAFAAVGWFPFFGRNPSMAGIKFRTLRRGADRRHYIWIHGNEATAREILEEHMRAKEGRAFLIESSERNVGIRGGKIDPNRMFSRAGAERSLRALNPDWEPNRLESALDDLDDDRSGFLGKILPRPGDLIVAMHNNGPNYSVNDEVPISNSVAMNDPEHPDEFVLCSTRSDFSILANSRFNAILQDKPQGEDDGSLSRLCAARGIRYVNIEAGMGNREAQKRMLDWVELAVP